MSEIEITFLNRKVYKGVRFNKEPILDVQRHHKPTRSPWANKKPVHVLASTTRREEMLHSRRSARASKDWFLSNDFWENITNWENRLIERDYPVPIVIKYLSELKFADRKTFLQQSNKSARKKLQPSVTKGCCRCTLLAENSSISLAGREKQIHFSQQSPKMLWSCFSFFFLKISRWVSLYCIVELGEKNYRWAMEQNFNWNFRVNLLWFSRFFFSFLD